MQVQRRLAGSWFRHARSWWVVSAILLGTIGALFAGSLSLTNGTQDGLQQVMEDQLTGDLRITYGSRGLMPNAFHPDPDARVQSLQSGTRTIERVTETQAVLARNFIEAAFFASEGSTVSQGGHDGAFELGLLSGRDLGTREALESLSPYLVAGRFPSAGSQEILIPVNMVPRLLSATDKDQVTTLDERLDLLASRTYELSAGRVRTDGDTTDLHRLDVRIVGVLESNMVGVDDYVLIADRGLANSLMLAPEDASNLLLVHGNTANLPLDTRERTQSAAELESSFTGPLLDTLRAVMVALNVLLALLPGFLLIHGLRQQWQERKPELRIVHAMGITKAQRLGSVGLLLTGLFLISLAVLVASWMLLGILVGTSNPDLALPVSYSFDLMPVLGGALLATGTMALAWLSLLPLERGQRANL